MEMHKKAKAFFESEINPCIFPILYILKNLVRTYVKKIPE